MRRSSSWEGGFTVAEILMASVILLIIVTGAMSGIIFASQASAMSARRVEATSLASQQIELARNLPFDDVSTVVPSNGLPAGDIQTPVTVGPYTVTTTVAYGAYGAVAAARYKTITVTVSWTDPVPGSITVSSVVAGASGTQDYNFGTVKIWTLENGSSADPLSGVSVQLTDINNRTYSVVTTASGVATFDYVPSGSITVNASLVGYLADTLMSPSCVANTITTLPVSLHRVRTAVITCTAQSGKKLSGMSLTVNGATKTTDVNGTASFSVIDGSNAITAAGNASFAATSDLVTVSGADVAKTVVYTAKTATVNATTPTKSGTIYVYNSAGTLVTSKAAGSTSPYTATFTFQHADDNPVTYDLSRSNVWHVTDTTHAVTAGSTNTWAAN
jgi:hypothetical protein